MLVSRFDIMVFFHVLAAHKDETDEHLTYETPYSSCRFGSSASEKLIRKQSQVCVSLESAFIVFNL